MKAVCLISGGMDSSTLAYVAKDMGYDILALHTSYGQLTEAKELACAQKIAASLDALEFMHIPLTHLKVFGGSSLTDTNLKVHSHVEDEDGGKGAKPANASAKSSAASENNGNAAGAGELPNTYVPFRNSNLLAIATSYAETRNADAIFIGVQSSDYAGYPDCRPEYIEAFQRVIDLGTSDSVHIKLMTPFVRMNKKQILEKGLRLGVPYEHTWSCYRNSENACGTCDSCYYRLKAFNEIGIEDPIPYEKAIVEINKKEPAKFKRLL
ncbi:MAG: 7-cyano-7-deazaguanine synthase QueC [Methanomicrobium sp.]|nr:7-cyano-7-deazaguanine synthase QueC [Methanomicrobium sp.]